jgi:hypothetical protein
VSKRTYFFSNFLVTQCTSLAQLRLGEREASKAIPPSSHFTQMPRAIGTPEQIARWNNFGNAKLQSLVERHTINIDDIILVFSESI